MNTTILNVSCQGSSRHGEFTLQFTVFNFFQPPEKIRDEVQAAYGEE